MPNQNAELLPCPWCGAMADREDEWGTIIVHKESCYWRNIQGGVIGGEHGVRVNNSDKDRWNTRALIPASTEPEPENRRIQRELIREKIGDGYERVSDGNVAIAARLMLMDLHYLMSLPNAPASPAPVEPCGVCGYVEDPPATEGHVLCKIAEVHDTKCASPATVLACPHLRQTYPGTQGNECLDCGARLPEEVAEVPADLYEAVKEFLAARHEWETNPAVTSLTPGLALDKLRAVFALSTSTVAQLDTNQQWVRNVTPSISEQAQRAAEKIFPNCLSRTCFRKDIGRDHCWGCDDQAAERKRVAAIIEAEYQVPEKPNE